MFMPIIPTEKLPLPNGVLQRERICFCTTDDRKSTENNEEFTKLFHTRCASQLQYGLCRATVHEPPSNIYEKVRAKQNKIKTQKGIASWPKSEH